MKSLWNTTGQLQITVTNHSLIYLTQLIFISKLSVANELSLSGGPLIQRIKLMEELDNPNYNGGIVDSDLLDYYKMLANKGDAQAQVLYS